MRSFDLTPLLRASVGFENLDRLFDTATGPDGGDGYPPYNIEKLGEDTYQISMAVAGFSREELDLTVQENTLVVTGRTVRDAQAKQRHFIHHGIARRPFERRFELADTIKVNGADYRDGLLVIDLVRQIPEHKKPRKISIGAHEGFSEDAVD